MPNTHIKTDLLDRLDFNVVTADPFSKGGCSSLLGKLTPRHVPKACQQRWLHTAPEHSEPRVIAEAPYVSPLVSHLQVQAQRDGSR